MPSESEALVTEYRGRSIHKKFNNRDKSRGKSRDKFNGRSWVRKDVECFYCHEKGHMKRECRKLKREQQENGDASNIVATIFQGNEVIFVCDDGHVNLTSQETCWVVDSGASFHVTSRRDFFSFYTRGDFGHVRMGNDNTSKIMGK